MRDNVELRPNQTEMVLASYNAPPRVAGGTTTPHKLYFCLSTRMGACVSRKASSDVIAFSFHGPPCRFVRSGGRLKIETPRQRSVRALLLDLCHRLDHRPPRSPLVGMDEVGALQLLDVRCPRCDQRYCGLAQMMALSLALHNARRMLQLVLIDPKRCSLRAFSVLPHSLCSPLGCVAGA
ncbi:MAG TPA: hypothetical protein VMY98_01710 [Anaerolineae bacterium]|nr:hypothetical protein [Anaerolineae bacterium]